jgi:hypothetical protein
MVHRGSKRTPAERPGRQRGVAGAANRIEALSDQPFDVCPSLRDTAKNLAAAGFRFDIANPHLKPMFSVLAALYEGGIHGDRDRRRRCRRPDRGSASKRRASLQSVAAQGPGVDAGVDRKYVLQQISAQPVRHQSGRCARSRSSSGVERQCDGQLMPVSMRPHAAQRNRGSLNVTCPNSVATAWSR